MPTQPLDITAIQALHQAGHLDEAERAYLTLLKQQPDDALSLHFLGILYVEQAKLDKAQDCFERAVNFEPDNPVLQLHLANVLKRKGLSAESEKILLTAAAKHPQFAAIYNNLGALYFTQERWQLAVDAYQQAIHLQANYVDAYYNLGLAFNKLKKYADAMNAFKALIALSPEHVGAHFQIGSLLMQQYQYQQALEQFLIIHQAHPYHFETLVNIGACYVRLNKLEKAKTFYLHALDVVPNDTYVIFNLGVLEAQEGHSQRAIDYYLRAIAIDPDFYPAHYNAGVSSLATKNRAAALAHFQNALRLHPDESVTHLINVLMGEKDISASPPAYIRSLFDTYADHYDQHMLRTLHYQVPSMLGEWIDFAHEVDKRKWNALDLGCGTGLSGEYLSKISERLVGVDLSEQMLALAQAKHIYDELVCADILSYLQDTKERFDVVVAGDVLVYFGDLTEVFADVARVLTVGGWFLFNVEKDDMQDFQIKSSGRFGHGQKYVEQLAGTNQLEVVKRQEVVLREQDGEPVLGWMYLLTRL